MLAIRITRPFSALKPVFDKLVNYSSKFIVYEHTDAARLHIHGLIVDCKPSTDTLKNWIRSEIGKVEKTDWSFVSKDVNEGFIRYMAKGKLEPSMVHNFEQSVIDNYKNTWEDRPKLHKQQRLTFVVKETPAERKLRQEDMLKEIFKRLESGNDLTDKNIIATIYRVVAVENKNVIGRYKVRDYYDTVLAKVKPEAWMYGMERLVAKNFFPE